MEQVGIREEPIEAEEPRLPCADELSSESDDDDEDSVEMVLYDVVEEEPDLPAGNLLRVCNAEENDISDSEGGVPAEAHSLEASVSSIARVMQLMNGLDNHTNNLQCFDPVILHDHSYRRTAPVQSGKKKVVHSKGLSQDEATARILNIPMPLQDLVTLPVTRLVKMLTKEQVAFAQDIRRRGRNRMAVQKLRQRIMDGIESLEHDLKEIREKKIKLKKENELLTLHRDHWNGKLIQLYKHIFQSLRDPTGRPYSPVDYCLEIMEDGSVHLMDQRFTPPMLVMQELASDDEA